MSKFVKKNLHEIAISGIRQFNQKAENIDGVIKLTLGELDFNTDQVIKDAAINALNNNDTRYTLNAGINELRKKIALSYEHYHHNEIIVTVGTTEGLSTVIKSVIEPNDEIIIPTPGYVGYEPLVLLEGGKVVEIDITKSNNKITTKDLYNSYTQRTKAILITNPNNPTGKILSLDEMEAIKQFVIEKDILLIVDEIYSDIDFEDKFTSFTIYKDLKENIVCLNGFSKSHAMTGFRIGYLIADELLVKHLLKTHQYSVTSATSISQHAALQAIETDNKKMISTLKERRDYLCQRLDEMGLEYMKPDGAFYVFVKISQYAKSSVAFCEKLLYMSKVACIPGESFLGHHNEYIRLSYALNIDVLKEALNRLEDFIKKLS